MSASVAEALCTRCGICCRGVFLDDVDLTEREVWTIESLGLDVDADGEAAGVLTQPCPALAGRRCSIYEHRPRACRAFECLLLQRAIRGETSLEEALATVAEALKRIARLDRLLPTPSPSGERRSLRERYGDETQRLAAQKRRAPERERALSVAMASVDAIVSTSFTGGGG